MHGETRGHTPGRTKTHAEENLHKHTGSLKCLSPPSTVPESGLIRTDGRKWALPCWSSQASGAERLHPQTWGESQKGPAAHRRSMPAPPPTLSPGSGWGVGGSKQRPPDPEMGAHCLVISHYTSAIILCSELSPSGEWACSRSAGSCPHPHKPPQRGTREDSVTTAAQQKPQWQRKKAACLEYPGLQKGVL